MSANLITTLLLCLFLVACNTNQSPHTNPDSENDTAALDQTTQQSAESTAAPTVGVAPVNQQPATGIDLSKFQGDEINTLSAQADGFSFIICKATEGITYTDPKFSLNWNTIAKDGFIRGAYHFFRSQDDPKAQAENYLNAISDLNANDLPPIVDFEGAGIDRNQSVETVQKNLLSFLQIVENKLNRKPIIYTDNPSGNKYLNETSFSAYGLWIAFYEDTTAPRLPATWENWNFWQKTSQYKLDGQRNDFDVFNGSKADLLKFIETY